MCLSFPGTTEGIKWEDHICFMVAEKLFCITGAEGGVSLKTTPEQFDELTERTGIVPTPYMARNKWVTIQQWHTLSISEWNYYIKNSYLLIFGKLPKRTRELINPGT